MSRDYSSTATEGMSIYRGGFFSKPLSYIAQPIAAVIGTIVSLVSFVAVASILAVTRLRDEIKSVVKPSP